VQLIEIRALQLQLMLFAETLAPVIAKAPAARPVRGHDRHAELAAAV
jgi:hypothetical protein